MVGWKKTTRVEAHNLQELRLQRAWLDTSADLSGWHLKFMGPLLLGELYIRHPTDFVIN